LPIQQISSCEQALLTAHIGNATYGRWPLQALPEVRGLFGGLRAF